MIRVLAPLIGLIAAAMLGGCSPHSQAPRGSTQTAVSAPIENSKHVHVFSIGRLSAMALRDGTLEFTNDNKVFGVGRTSAEVAALLKEARLPADRVELSIQPLLIKTTDRTLLFDAGAGPNLGASGGQLPTSLAAAGIDVASVTDVFISHAHADHVGGLMNAAGALAFPNATIHISSPEWDFLKGMTAEAVAKNAIARHAALIGVITPKVAEFAPGAEIISGIVQAVDIRGHTPGHSSFVITSDGSSLLYVGDTMHHFVVSVRRPDWTIAFDTDARAAQASRRALLARSAQSQQRLYAVHFPFPGLGKVQSEQDGFAWIPE